MIKMIFAEKLEAKYEGLGKHSALMVNGSNTHLQKA
jgi:hypothetical protein